MTKEDFTLIAKSLRETKMASSSELVAAHHKMVCSQFCADLATDNQNFNHQKFMEACGYPNEA